MKYSTVYTIFILSIFILYLMANYSFKDGKPTCNNFVVNTYLYLAFSICYLGLSIHFIHELLFNGEKTYSVLMRKIAPYFLIIFIASLLLIIAISMQPTFDTKTSNVIYNHFLWLLFVSAIALFMTPRVTSKETEEYVDEVLYIVIAIFVAMSSLVYIFPTFFNNSFSFMYPALLVSLIVIIVAEIYNYFTTKSQSKFTEFRRIISYAVIFIFSLYVSYDTAKVIKLSSICVNYPNYPKTSVMFFLDVINLFSRILFLKSNK